MKMTRKFLSVLLAVVMVITSCSVGFSVFAEVSDDTLQQLGEAIKNDWMETVSWTQSAAATTGSGDAKTQTTTTTIQASSYSEFLEICKVIELIYKAVEETDEYKNYKQPAENSNAEKEKQCTNFTYLKSEIISSLKDAGYTDAIEGSKFSAFLDQVLNMSNVKYYHEDKKANTNTSSSTVPHWIYSDTNVTFSYKAYLDNFDGTYDKVPDSFYLGKTFRAIMGRVKYIKSSLGGFVTTSYYHNGINLDDGDVFDSFDSNNNTDVKGKLNEYANKLTALSDILNLGYIDLLSKNQAELDALDNQVKAVEDEITAYVGSRETFEKLYADWMADITKFHNNIASAKEFESSCELVNDVIDNFITNPDYVDYGTYNYGGFNYDKMIEDYAAFMEAYKQIETFDDLLTTLDELGWFDDKSISSSQDIKDYYNNFTDNVVVYDLKETADKANALYEEYKDNHSDLEITEQETAYTLLSLYIESFADYSEQVINTIFPDGYDYLLDLQDKLYCDLNGFVAFFVRNSKRNDIPTGEIEWLISVTPENLEGLRAFYASLVEATGEERANELLGETMKLAENFADSLYQVLADRFTKQVLAADEVYTAAGRPKKADIRLYQQVKNVFNILLGDDILTYLSDNEKDSLVTDETIEIYKALFRDILEDYNNFSKSYGLNAYQQTELEYPIRNAYENDKVKDPENPYKVEKETFRKTLDTIVDLLFSEDFKNLTNLDIKQELEKVPNLLDNLYTDDLINTVVKFLYPLVAAYFVDAWDGIGNTIQVDNPIGDGKLNVKIELNAVEDAMKTLGLELFPRTLADNVRADYPQVANVLAKATSAASVKNNPWEEEVLLDENGNLALEWGVTDKESFIKAATAALSGLDDLLFAIVTNKPMNLYDKVGTGTTVVTGLPIINVAGVKIDPINLKLEATANDGYNNGIAPIFEALGAENLPNVDENSSIEDVLRYGLIDPIEEILKKLANDPIETVLSILPNIAYAVEAGMILPLLSKIGTEVTYSADAYYKVDGSAVQVVGGVLGLPTEDWLYGALKPETIPIVVGDLIDLDSLPVDLNSIDGLLTSVLSLLGLDVTLPKMDGITLATLGKLTEKPTNRSKKLYEWGGKNRAYIEADTTDVAYFLLNYVLNIVEDKNTLINILSAFIKNEDAINTITKVLDTLSLANPGDVIAAVVELLNAEKYPEIEAFDYENFTPGEYSGDVDALYSVFWSRDEAQYVADNLVEFVTKLAALIGYDLNDLVKELLTGLYTRDNLVALAELVQGLIEDKLLSNDTITTVLEIADPLIKDLNVQEILDKLMNYTVPENFEDGNRAAFVAELVRFITPAVPVLKVLLLEDNNLVISLPDTEATEETEAKEGMNLVTVYSYNGYNSALIPILEALSCEGIVPYDTFKTLDDAAMVMAVLNPILDLIDSITESDDMVQDLINIIPNILYFISNEGLNQAVDNLLRPVYVVLDVIRPIIDVDLSIDFDLNKVLSDLLASAGLDSIDYSDISALLQASGELDEDLDSVAGGKRKYLKAENALTPELVTIVLRLAVNTLLVKDNSDAIIESLRERGNLSEKDIESVREVLDSLRALTTDEVLFVLYYVFFGANTGMEHFGNLAGLVSENMQKALNAIANLKMDDSELAGHISDVAREFLKAIKGIIDNGAQSGNSTLGFLSRLMSFWQKLIEFFQRVFTVFDVSLDFKGLI